jgi:hypothetical protein
MATEKAPKRIEISRMPEHLCMVHLLRTFLSTAHGCYTSAACSHSPICRAVRILPSCMGRRPRCLPPYAGFLSLLCWFPIAIERCAVRPAHLIVGGRSLGTFCYES